MSSLQRAVVVLAGVAALCLCGADAPAKKKVRPKDGGKPAKQTTIRIAKETTYLTEPIDAEGYVDYLRAVNERHGAGVTPANNFEVVLRDVMGPAAIPQEIREEYYRKLGFPLSDEGDFFQDYQTFATADGGDRQQAVEDEQAIQSAPWKAAEHPLAARWLEAQGQRLDRLVSESSRSRFYSPYVAGKETSPLVGVILSSMQQMRGIARALKARALLRIGNGDLTGAWQDLQVLHRMARHAASGSWMLESLVAVSIDAMAADGESVLLASNRLTPQQLREYLADLSKLRPLPPCAEKLEYGERLMVLDGAQYVARRGIKKAKVTGLEGLEAIFPDSGAGNVIDWNTAMKMLNEHIDRVVAAAKETNRIERRRMYSALEDEIKKAAGETRGNPVGTAATVLLGGPAGRGRIMGQVLVSALSPAVQAFPISQDRAQARLNLTRLAFALVLARRIDGKFPESLDRLTDGIVAEIPLDPFTDKAFVYQPAENGFVVYSLGDNGEDDGGIAQQDRNPQNPKADDIVLRISFEKNP